MKLRYRLIAVTVVWGFWTLLSLKGCLGADIDIKDSQAVRAIIGEASGEGYEGMLAVAVGIRNRGTLKGVYGLHAKHVDKQPEWVWLLAEEAWRDSESNRVHEGTHWESTDFDVPYWAKGMKEVYRYGKHVFYVDK